MKIHACGPGGKTVHLTEVDRQDIENFGLFLTGALSLEEYYARCGILGGDQTTQERPDAHATEPRNGE